MCMTNMAAERRHVAYTWTLIPISRTKLVIKTLN